MTNFRQSEKRLEREAGIRTLRRSYTLCQVHPRQLAWPDERERERERIVSRVPVVLEMVPCMCGQFKFRKYSSDECQLLLEIFLVWFMMQILHLHSTLQNCSVFGKRRVCIIHLKKRIVSCIVEATAARPLNIAGSVRVHVRNLGFYNRLASETRFYVFMPNHLCLVLP